MWGNSIQLKRNDRKKKKNVHRSIHGARKKTRHKEYISEINIQFLQV